MSSPPVGGKSGSLEGQNLVRGELLLIQSLLLLLQGFNLALQGDLIEEFLAGFIYSSINMVHLFCHYTGDLPTIRLPVSLLMRGSFGLEVWLLLLRELEPNVLLIDRGPHGSTAFPSSKHETGRKLRATGRTYRIYLFLLRSKGGKAWCHKALRLRARLMPRLRIIVLLNLAVLKWRTPGPILGIFHHRSKMRGERVEVTRKA